MMRPRKCFPHVSIEKMSVFLTHIYDLSSVILQGQKSTLLFHHVVNIQFNSFFSVLTNLIYTYMNKNSDYDTPIYS